MNLIDIIKHDVGHTICNELHGHTKSILMSVCTSLHNMHKTTIISLNNFIRHCTYDELAYFEPQLKASRIPYLLHSYGRWDILLQTNRYVDFDHHNVEYDINSYENACGMFKKDLYGKNFINEMMKKNYYIEDYPFTISDVNLMLPSDSNLFCSMYDKHKKLFMQAGYTPNVSFKNYKYCLERNIAGHFIQTCNIIVQSLEEFNFIKSSGYLHDIISYNIDVVDRVYEKYIIGPVVYGCFLQSVKCDMSDIKNYHMAKKRVTAKKLLNLIEDSPNGMCDEALDYYYEFYVSKWHYYREIVSKWNTDKYIRRLVEIHNYIPTFDDLLYSLKYTSYNVSIYLLSVMDQKLFESKKCKSVIMEHIMKNDNVEVLKYIISNGWEHKKICDSALAHDAFYCFVYICKKFNIDQFPEMWWNSAGHNCHTYMTNNKK